MKPNGEIGSGRSCEDSSINTPTSIVSIATTLIFSATTELGIGMATSSGCSVSAGCRSFLSTCAPGNKCIMKCTLVCRHQAGTHSPGDCLHLILPPARRREHEVNH